MLKDQEKNKVSNLFQFLKQYNNVKNPTITDINLQYWHRWLDNIPIHEKIINNICKEDEYLDSILIVGKPDFTECPNPPEELREWLENGWSKFDEEVKIKNEINKIEKDITTGKEKIIKIKFQDDKEREDLLKAWKLKREIWVEKEKITHEVDDLFNMLYTVYSTLKKNLKLWN